MSIFDFFTKLKTSPFASLIKTNYKNQITNKIQILISKSQTQTGSSVNVFGFLVIGHCDLFVICYLNIVI